MHFICLSRSSWGEGVWGGDYWLGEWPTAAEACVWPPLLHPMAQHEGGPSSLFPFTGHNVCAGISTCWCMAISDLLDHSHGVKDGGGMRQGVLLWWLAILLVNCHGKCIRIYKLRHSTLNIVVIIVQPLVSMVTAHPYLSAQ